MKVLDASLKKKIKYATQFSTDVNQLYHPTGKFGQDVFDLVYFFDSIQREKFIPILLKEWFYLLKKDGYLVIDYQPTKTLDFQELERMMWWLWKEKYEIVFHAPVKTTDTRNMTSASLTTFIKIQDQPSRNAINRRSLLSEQQKTVSTGNPYMRFICKKTISTVVPDDAVDKWTFGIITNGKRLDWIDKIIDSIRQQKISQYEIVICGTYYDRKEKDISYIPFNKRDDWGWITKKKNLILEKAKYNNVCILHDRMYLDKNWYKGMKKWGNCFEILGCKQLFEKERVNDWTVQHNHLYRGEKELFSISSYASYEDWYPSVWFLGQLYILKKHIPVRLNETVYYGQSEDFIFSNDLTLGGYLHRFNPYASVLSFTHKYINATRITFNGYDRSPRMQVNNLPSLIKYMTYVTLKTASLFHIYPSQKLIENLSKNVYSFILRFSSQKRKDYLESKSVTAK